MASLDEVLVEARALGFLGPGPVGGHIEHAEGFARAVGDEPGRVVDLGSGGGVPGLVLALVWPTTRVALLDSSERRALFLVRAALALDVEDRVTVIHARAEDVGRDPDWRAHADVVVARSFAGPAVTAECGAPLLRVGGRLVVSEPPSGSQARWPDEPLRELGLRPSGRLEQSFSRFQLLTQERLCPPEYPRRVGVPAKRPLF